jgi:hypothetical protein
MESNQRVSTIRPYLAGNRIGKISMHKAKRYKSPKHEVCEAHEQVNANQGVAG